MSQARNSARHQYGLFSRIDRRGKTLSPQTGRIKYGIKNATIFIVTQRVTSIKDADIIVCIDKGHVVGMGKHNDLLEKCEVYKEIYESQTK